MKITWINLIDEYWLIEQISKDKYLIIWVTQI